VPIQRCPLCLQVKEVVSSHLMPRSLYKKSRGPGKKGNQDPLTVDASGKRPSSYQVEDHLLCPSCEDRFNRNGEHYVMQLLTTREGRFPLLEMLQKVTTSMVTSEWTGYATADTPNIDREKIAYFAISVFWRASIHIWKLENAEEVKIDLGKKYNEEIRRYLLGETPIPLRAALTVVVCTDARNQSTFFMPAENQKTRDRSVGFGARGMIFMFRIGKTMAPYQRRLSMINNQEGLITAYDCTKHSIWHLAS